MHNIVSLAPSLVIAAIFVLAPASVFAQLRAQLVASGFERPLAVVPDPTAANTLIVVQRNGLALALIDGLPQPTPFLDLRGVVIDDNEQGLLGLAFAPHDPNQVFVSFTNKRDPSIAFPTFEHGDTVVARFRRSLNPLVLDPATRFDLVWPPPLPGAREFPFIYQPTDVHKGGNLIFGPDGFLYIGFGDGGAGNTPEFNAQHPQTLLGKMVRIDVNVPATHPKGYVIPPDNPFVDKQPIAALGEIWAFGYRNPWRFSFDDFGVGRTNALIVGDVGLETREEIDYEPAGRGGRNYGWYIREGLVGTPGISQATPAPRPFTDPILDYENPINGAKSVTGGHIYRGNALSWPYRGRYFLADFFGGVYSLGLTFDAAGEARVLDMLDHTNELGNPRLIPSFGRGLDGELYFSSFVGGSIYKIVSDTPPLPAPPAPFTGQVRGTTLSLSWQPSPIGGPTIGYRLEAGSQPGVADLAALDLLAPSLTVTGVPNGLFYLRVRALNSSGASEPSQELTVRVGCGGPLPAPVGLSAQVGPGGNVSLTWTPTAEATSYVIEAGTASGTSNIGVIPVAVTNVSGVVVPGTYFARVRAVTACGTSGVSNEVMIQVP